MRNRISDRHKFGRRDTSLHVLQHRLDIRVDPHFHGIPHFGDDQLTRLAFIHSAHPLSLALIFDQLVLLYLKLRVHEMHFSGQAAYCRSDVAHDSFKGAQPFGIFTPIVYDNEHDCRAVVVPSQKDVGSFALKEAHRYEPFSERLRQHRWQDRST